MVQNQTQDVVELQFPSASKSKDLEETSNNIDTSTASSGSIAQNDLSAKALDSNTTVITLTETQCVNTESEPVTDCVDTQTPATETQCTSTETEVRSTENLNDKKALPFATIEESMSQTNALDQDKGKSAGERKGCQEEACSVGKSLLKRELLLQMEKNSKLEKELEGMKAETDAWRTEKMNFFSRASETIKQLQRTLEDERESYEEQREALTRENTLLKSKYGMLEDEFKNCKTKLIISYRRMAQLRKKLPESDDAVSIKIYI